MSDRIQSGGPRSENLQLAKANMADYLLLDGELCANVQGI